MKKTCQQKLRLRQWENKLPIKYKFDCSAIIDDGLFTVQELTDSILGQIKWHDQRNQQTVDKFPVKAEIIGNGVVFTCEIPLSKQAFRFMAKKFTSTQGMRPFVRFVQGSTADSYKAVYVQRLQKQ